MTDTNEFLDQLALDWANDKVTINEALRIAFIKGWQKGDGACDDIDFTLVTDFALGDE